MRWRWALALFRFVSRASCRAKPSPKSYELEYGTDQLEIHVDAIKEGDKVLVVDDLLATGGTIDATVKLIRRPGGEVHDAAFIINLFDLGGEQRPEKNWASIAFSPVPFPGH